MQPETFTVGGNIAGLSGTGLVLALDSGEQLAIMGNGAFVFDTALVAGAGYSVSVTQQPVSPSQTCTVTAGTGAVANANATDIAVTCVTQSFSIGVSVTGLAGGSVLLNLNGSDALTFTADGMQAFPAQTASGTSYEVRVRRQPRFPYQRCTVASATGTVGAADLMLAVTCAAAPQLAVRAGLSCIVKTDGTLWCGPLGLAPAQLGSAANWAEVSVGDSHNCAIKLDGTLWCWGYNGNGQLGNGTTSLTPTSSPSQVGSDTTWRTVAAGGERSCGVKSDSTLWCWGRNILGELLDGGLVGDQHTPHLSIVSDVVEVGAGSYFTCALTKSRAMICAGDFSPTNYTPTALGSGYTSIFVGAGQACGVRADGSLWCHEPGNSSAGSQIGTAKTWESVDPGTTHMCGIQVDGSLWCHGSNASYELGDGTTTMQASPKQIGAGTQWTTVGAGAQGSCALTDTRALYCWGQIAAGPHWTPAQVMTNVEKASTGESQTCAIKSDGTLWCWGANGGGQLGLGDTTSRQAPTAVGTATWSAIAAGAGEQSSHNCAVRTNGTLWCWGSNSYAQLGDGTTTQRNVPTQVGTGTTWTTPYVGGTRSCALRADGTLWCWGTSSNTQISTPTQVGADTNWARLAMSEHHTCAVRTDGTLWCWGSGYVATPTQVGSASAWSKLASWRNGSCATRTDNTLWCWGNGSTPTQVGSATTWASIATAYNHKCATRIDGSLWCWGTNAGGALGDPQLVSPTDPTQIGADLTWSAVSTSGQSESESQWSCGLRTDKSLWCWGANGAGQLGTNDRWRTVPTPVP